MIGYLCRYENVYPLAKDIVAHGLNPLEMFALIPEDAEGAANTFIVAEGNRRLSDANRLRALEEENARLKRLLADTILDNAGLKDLLSKKW